MRKEPSRTTLALPPPQGRGRRLLPFVWALLIACSAGQPAAGQRQPSAAATQPASVAPTPAPTPTLLAPQRQEAPLPEPRQEIASASVDGRLYVLGGFDPGGRSSSSAFVYDGTWRTGPPLPVALDHPAAAVLDGRLYLAGGYASGPASRRLFRLEGDHWTELAPMRYPRGAPALAVAAGLLVALGGSNGAQDLAPIEAYDPAANAWRDIGTLPAPRNHISGFSLEGQACAAGGRSPNSPRVDCVDPRSGAVKRLPDLPTPTSGAGAGELAGTVVVAGGEDAQESRMITQLQRLTAGAWASEPMLLARHGVALAQYQGRLWACGGADQPGYHAVTTCTSIG